MFYFEVKPRRSGKSTRLLNNLMIQHEWNKISKKYEGFYIIAPNYFMNVYLKNIFIGEFGNIDSDIYFLTSYRETRSVLRTNKRYLFFVDECLYADNFLRNFDLFKKRLDDCYLTSTCRGNVEISGSEIKIKDIFEYLKNYK